MTQTVKVERPSYVPENFWDATAGKVKDTEFSQHFNELTAFKAAEDSKRLTLPQKPEDYKLELPKDFKAPEGMDAPAFDDTNPLSGKFREYAAKHHLTQDAASDLLSLYAADKLDGEQMIANARAGEIQKLGVTGPQRVDAVTAWLKAMDVAQLADPQMGVLWTADTIKSFEKLIQRSAGGGTFSQQHRELPPANGSIPGIDKMSFREARAAQDAAAAKSH